MAETNQMLRCFRLGLFVHDNINDLKHYLDDIREWPETSDQWRDATDTADGFFDALLDAVVFAEDNCDVPPSTGQEIGRAKQLFDKKDYTGAEEILENLEISQQVVAYNQLKGSSPAARYAFD